MNRFERYGCFPINPGIYTVSLVLENTVSKEFTAAEKTICVPEGGRLLMNPLILARNVVRDASIGAGRAFQAGAIQLYPSVNKRPSPIFIASPQRMKEKRPKTNAIGPFASRALTMTIG